jgi:hypothetical protein
MAMTNLGSEVGLLAHSSHFDLIAWVENRGAFLQVYPDASCAIVYEQIWGGLVVVLIGHRMTVIGHNGSDSNGIAFDGFWPTELQNLSDGGELAQTGIRPSYKRLTP